MYKSTNLPAVILLLMITFLATNAAIAQPSKTPSSPPYNRPVNLTPEDMVNNPSNANYSFKILKNPDENIGYDIMRNGQIMFHQQMLQLPQNSSKGFLQFLMLANQVKNAALLSIEKIKKGQSPQLSAEEMKMIFNSKQTFFKS